MPPLSALSPVLLKTSQNSDLLH
ncbi:hypothetical protein CCACVL1_29733 [Corchorus capsularis]|uniref:Uncharacterized protein n=1 Tax=Corchorus capsularis TaxID=210143 RepID=A0A1R3G0B8_COCAP|nr:hypothetical protein CCACVL1_29733 [Corchorus capsularis]